MLQHSEARTGGAISELSWLRRYDGAWLVLLALPLLLLALNHNWIVGPLYHDSWLYFGYYHNLVNHLKTFNHLYYGCRLSVILPGWLAYRFLPPLAANHALHLGLYYVSVGALYLVLKETVNRRAAFLASLCMGGHFFFLSAVGWDNPDGFGIAYFLLATLLLTMAVRSPRWRLVLAAAGSAAAALVIANLSYGILLPFLAAHYLTLNRDRRRHPVLASAFWVGVGAVGLTLAFSLLNQALTGQFWFLRPSFQFAHDYSQQPRCPEAFRAWLPTASWLVFPMLCGLVALVRLGLTCRHGPGRSSRPGLYYQLQLVLMLLTFVVLEQRVFSLLRCWFYASLLLPATFLALGDQLSGLLATLRPRQFRVLAVTATLVVLLAAVLPWGGQHWAGPSVPSPLLAWPPAAALVLVLCWRSPGLKTGMLFLFLFGVVQFVTRHSFKVETSMPFLDSPDMTFQSAKQRYVQEADLPLLRPYAERMRTYDSVRPAVLRAMAKSLRVITAVDPSSNVYFWFNLTDPNGVLFDNLACAYTWDRRIINLDFPADKGGTALGVSKLRAGLKVAILTTEGDCFAAAVRSLCGCGLEARLLCQQRISRPPIAYTLTMIETVLAPAAGAGASPEDTAGVAVAHTSSH